ncbi:MAG: peptidylprolyl isomerase [Bacteroidota bacterium]
MVKRLLLAFFFFSFCLSLSFGQAKDPVLFTVNDTPVHVSEFNYIYTKTNGKEADYSKKAVEEYLDLYVKFKLKVERAKEMQLDTIPQLITELQGYRRQLADSYLMDKEVTDRLIAEAYERSKQDVDISHILVKLDPKATPQDTLKALLNAKDIKKRLESGEDFTTLATQVSEDPSVGKNKGHIGYVTVLFPKGFYNFETAAYTQELGVYSDPIRTSAGYHILRVDARRPARGQVEVAHILLRTKNKVPSEVKTRADSLYQLLKRGARFEELARKLSEDRNTASKGGNIGIFGINRYEKSFEDAAFSLEEGQYSDPVRTSTGWHIIKVISKKGIQPYNIEKNRLGKKIQEDPRYEAAKVAMIEQIKKDGKFQEEPKVLEEFIAAQNDTFLTFRWRAPKNPSTERLFSIGDQTQTLGDFTNYLSKSSKERLRKGRNSTPESVAKELYELFVNQQMLAYEESRLEQKYPEFKSLMREYEEGILLFEATKIEVWDKASSDSVGLAKFFKTINGKYRWEERAVVDEYQINVETKEEAEKIADYIADHSANEVLKQFNTPEKIVVAAKERKYEKSRNKTFNKMKWEVGTTHLSEKKKRKSYFEVLKINELLPVANKTLKEARGYIVADYQDQLEREWVKALRDKYDVDINKRVLKSLIKKK